MLAEIGLHERPQLLLGVEQLHRERVVPEQASRDRRTVAEDDAVEPVVRLDVGGRLDEGPLELGDAADGADGGQFRSDARAGAADPMARR